MRSSLVALVASLVSSMSSAIDSGVDSREPVNVIVETGRDVGPCPEAGALSYPPAPFKGSAYFLRKANPTFAVRHDALTKRRAPWLHRMDGPSGANRLFTDSNGTSTLVFWFCKAGDCSANAAYGAYAPASGDYALEVREHDKSESLGSSSQALVRAISCARALDNRLRDRTSEHLKQRGDK